MEQQIRWGFLGCGKVVRKKSGEAFRRVPNSTIHAIMRRELSAAEEAARHFGAEIFCDTQEALLSSGIDAVYIATPPGLHYEQAMACLAAGKPVYLENITFDVGDGAPDVPFTRIFRPFATHTPSEPPLPRL